MRKQDVFATPASPASARGRSASKSGTAGKRGRSAAKSGSAKRAKLVPAAADDKETAPRSSAGAKRSSLAPIRTQAKETTAANANAVQNGSEATAEEVPTPGSPAAHTRSHDEVCRALPSGCLPDVSHNLHGLYHPLEGVQDPCRSHPILGLQRIPDAC